MCLFSSSTSLFREHRGGNTSLEVGFRLELDLLDPQRHWIPFNTSLSKLFDAIGTDAGDRDTTGQNSIAKRANIIHISSALKCSEGRFIQDGHEPAACSGQERVVH